MAFSKEIADEVMAMPLDDVRSELQRRGLGTGEIEFRDEQAARLTLFHRLRIERTPTEPPGLEGARATCLLNGKWGPI